MSLWDYLKICHQYGSPRCYAITSIEFRSLVVVHCMKKVDRIKKWELCPATYCFIHNHKIISGLNQLSQTAHFFVNRLPSTHGTTRYFLNSPWIGFNKCYLVNNGMSTKEWYKNYVFTKVCLPKDTFDNTQPIDLQHDFIHNVKVISFSTSFSGSYY